MLFNKTPVAVELFPLIDRHGRNVATIVSKATYVIADGVPQLVTPPRPLYFKDEFESTSRGAMMRLASDLTDYKPATDILVARPPGDLQQYASTGRRLRVQIGAFELSGNMADPWPFGPVARDEAPRKQLAGTYDDAWVADRMPLLPIDFDYRFNQTAPPQQIVSPYLRGDELMQLSGFTAKSGSLETRLPGRLVLIAANASGRYLTQPAVLDTLVVHIQPLMLEIVWRLSIPTRRSIEEVRYVFVYYPTLRSYNEVYGD